MAHPLTSVIRTKSVESLHRHQWFLADNAVSLTLELENRAPLGHVVLYRLVIQGQRMYAPRLGPVSRVSLDAIGMVGLGWLARAKIGDNRQAGPKRFLCLGTPFHPSRVSLRNEKVDL
jgi:hypothetical protein